MSSWFTTRLNCTKVMKTAEVLFIRLYELFFLALATIFPLMNYARQLRVFSSNNNLVTYY